MMALAIGIDLGTTYSCVGVFEHGKVQIVSNAGNRTTRSCVAFTDRSRLIGNEAIGHIATNARNTIFDTKRLIGRHYTDPAIHADAKHYPFKVVNRNGKVKIEVEHLGENKQFFPEEISAMVLGKMKAIAENYLGTAVRDAVVTVPAYFNDAQRQATKDAGIIAGLNILRITNEPTAAALAYGLQCKSQNERHVVVFDLGGGTFDVSILRIFAGNFEVKATAGDTHFGGENFDEYLVEFLATEFDSKYNTTIHENKQAMWRLRCACEQAKRALSQSEETLVNIKSLFEGIDFLTTIDRTKFEEICKDLFENLLVPVESALHDARLNPSQIDEVILVGGSTRIPKVQEMLAAFFNGRHFSTGVDPDVAVACGAAVQAAMLTHQDTTGALSDVILRDVTPLSLGLETAGGVMTPLIPRGTAIPATKTETFSTQQENQQDVLIQVYEGERSKTRDNNQLGEFQLSGIVPAPRGTPQIEVTYDVDANGILNVSAVEKSTGKSEKITINSDKHRLTQEDIDRLVIEAEKFQAADLKHRAALAARSKLETYTYQMKQIAEDYKISEQLTPNDRGVILEHVEGVLAWLEAHRIAEQPECEQQHWELENVCNPIIQKMYQDDTTNHEPTVQEVD